MLPPSQRGGAGDPACASSRAPSADAVRGRSPIDRMNPIRAASTRTDMGGFRPSATVARPRLGRLLPDGLDADVDLDLIAHHEAAALDHVVPRDTEILTIDPGVGLKSRAV